VQGRTGGTVVVPRIVGPIRRLRPVEVRGVEFLRANTDRTIKITLRPFHDVARDKPNVYALLPELTASKVEQISIEAAQPNLDLKTLHGLGDKTVIFGVINMGDPEPETPEIVAARIRAAFEHLPPERLIPPPIAA